VAARARGRGLSAGPADRVEALLEDILAGPAELAAVLHAQAEAIPEIPLGALSRASWRLVGMGSSRFAALDAAAWLRAAGRDAAAEVASASGGSPGGRDTLVIAISASGRTPEVIDAARRHRGTSFVLGLAARGNAPLLAETDAKVPLAAAHVEQSGIATLTYRATVAALAALGDQVPYEAIRHRLATAVPALQAVLDERDRWLARAADVLDAGRPIHVLADGARLGQAEQAALMLREAPRIPAVAFETGDWLHVGLYTLQPGDALLLLAGSLADDEVVDTVRRRGGVVVAVGPDGPAADVRVPLPSAALVDPLVRSLVEPAAAELLAWELWRRTSATAIPEPG
jgi:glutamine---fructose-6-phosphate transaminase (isomerizing)